MLVLSRHIGESFTIDGNIKIKILSDRGSIRVGIEAPKHIKILRDELLKTEENQKKLVSISNT